ncbi:MAG: hypothetical protein M3041_11290 [Acidobacteriota bacterium]|nr:hypothetical protein [Acidobacteriota bacterium]
MCSAHGAVRVLLGEIVGSEKRPTIVDIEAGLEHLSRGTARNVDTLLAIFEPYYKSMETAARVTELARELGIPHVFGVANKVRSSDDDKALREFAHQHNIHLLGSIPDDEAMGKADRAGVAPLDFDAGAPAIRAISELAARLQQS